MEKEQQTTLQIINTILNKDNYEEYLPYFDEPSIPKTSDNKAISKLTPYNISKPLSEFHFLAIQAVRVSALLHDIGHPPFSHITEYAIIDIYNEVKKKTENKNEREKRFIKAIENVQKNQGNRAFHEKTGDTITKFVFQEILDEVPNDIASEKRKQMSEKNFFTLIIYTLVVKIFNNEGIFGDIHSLVDSKLDGDRLDYCSRDLYNSGINVGTIDYDRIINEMKLFNDNERFIFCPPIKAVNSLEEFLKKRSLTYRSLIWHHRVIKTDNLLKRIIKFEVKKYLNSESNKKNKNEYGQLNGLWSLFDNEQEYPHLNIIKWNDSWLINVLRDIYYRRYFSDEDYSNEPLEMVEKARLDEFIQNKKMYYSIIKRHDDAFLLDKVIRSEIKKDNGVKEKVEAIKKFDLDIEKKEINDDKSINIDAILDLADLFISDKQEELLDDDECKGGYILNQINQKFNCLNVISTEDEKLSSLFDDVENELNQDDKQDYYGECMLATINLKSYKNEEVPVYANNEIRHLTNISRVNSLLDLENNYTPLLYIYVLIKEGVEFNSEFKKNIIKKVGDVIAKRLTVKLEQALTDLLEMAKKTKKELPNS